MHDSLVIGYNILRIKCVSNNLAAIHIPATVSNYNRWSIVLHACGSFVQRFILSDGKNKKMHHQFVMIILLIQPMHLGSGASMRTLLQHLRQGHQRSAQEYQHSGQVQ